MNSHMRTLIVILSALLVSVPLSAAHTNAQQPIEWSSRERKAMYALAVASAIKAFPSLHMIKYVAWKVRRVQGSAERAKTLLLPLRPLALYGGIAYLAFRYAHYHMTKPCEKPAQTQVN